MPSPTQESGFTREREAESFLAERGYQVEERNFRGAGGEIDIIAWEGEVLCFVEVRSKSRDDFGFPDETVDRRKQRKIIRAALAYLVQYPPLEMPMARFDVVSILRGEITLIRNAFDCGRG
jgi:putative endonuclease